MTDSKPKNKSLISLDELTYEPLNKRKLNQKTCEKWKYGKGVFKGKPTQVANYFNESGVLIAQKLRFADKTFTTLGEGKKLPLYGQWLWRDGGKRVTVVEGEIDALSISQAQDLKWAVVSVPNGAQSAAKAFKDNIEWLEKFDEVVICFDQDEPGREATEECAKILTPGKAKIASLPLKDASDMLQQGRTKELINALWDAKTYRIDGVLAVGDLDERVHSVPEWGLSYPWESVTKWTYGIRTSELIALGAGTGMGKTEIFKEIATHLIKEHGQSVGMLMLEERPEHTLKTIMGKWVSKLFHLPDANWTQDEFNNAYSELKQTNKLFLYDHFGHTDYDTIKSTIRFLHHAYGCRHIFLDHITALVSGDKDNDERKQLDYVMTDLASLARELDICVFFISHLASPEGKPHEEGGRVTIKQFRGSRAIGQWASFVLGLERNQQEQDIIKRHVSILRCLKDRYSGRATGETVGLAYETATGRLTETEAPETEGDVDDNEVGF